MIDKLYKNTQFPTPSQYLKNMILSHRHALPVIPYTPVNAIRHVRVKGLSSARHPPSLHVSSPLPALMTTYGVRCTCVRRSVYARAAYGACRHRDEIGMPFGIYVAYTSLFTAKALAGMMHKRFPKQLSVFGGQ